MADENQTKCLRCGSTNRVHGSLLSFGEVVFKKDDGDILDAILSCTHGFAWTAVMPSWWLQEQGDKS